MNKKLPVFSSLNKLADHLRATLENKKYILLFAYNGIGKTRLSMAFKDIGKNNNGADTLYFNAFTEDLFVWDNDLKKDTKRFLKLNIQSRFFLSFKQQDMDNYIRPFLQRYADFEFRIDYTEWTITFSRDDDYDIKISRGEEHIFIWCVFLAIVRLVIDDLDVYSWVKYLYIDDPISSLDDNNAIAVASGLAQLLKEQDRVKTVISSHHPLFFNVMHNELNANEKLMPYFLSKGSSLGKYTLRYTRHTPFFYHVALLKEMYEAQKSGKLYTYHFAMLRSLLEKSAVFHGFEHFSACIKKDKNDVDGRLHARIINVLSHGNYSLYEPKVMLDENKESFRKVLKGFMNDYQFNPEFFPKETTQESQT